MLLDMLCSIFLDACRPHNNLQRTFRHWLYCQSTNTNGQVSSMITGPNNLWRHEFTHHIELFCGPGLLDAYCSFATVCISTSFIMNIIKTSMQWQDPTKEPDMYLALGAASTDI